jgi:hypothetical protein
MIGAWQRWHVFCGGLGRSARMPEWPGVEEQRLAKQPRYGLPGEPGRHIHLGDRAPCIGYQEADQLADSRVPHADNHAGYPHYSGAHGRDKRRGWLARAVMRTDRLASGVQSALVGAGGAMMRAGYLTLPASAR